MQKLLMTSLIGMLLMGFAREAIGFLHQAPAGGKTVTVDMKEFQFIPNQITVDRGRITFEVRNNGELPHVLQITGAEVDTHIALLPGGATTWDILLTTPGEYILVCPIPTHPEQGMRGSLVVQ
jgi:uncharacterized cupredoxin-like copper-binding protein